MSAINEKALRQLVKLLSKKQLTIAGIAREMKCSVQVATKRLSMLEDRGVKFDTLTVTESGHGRAPLAYKLVTNRASEKLLVS